MSAVNTRQKWEDGDEGGEEGRSEGKRKSRRVHREQGQEETWKACHSGGQWVCLERKKDFAGKRKRRAREQTATGNAAPGASGILTHLLVVADLVLGAIGPSGSSRDGLPPGQGHALGLHSVPSNLILLPGPWKKGMWVFRRYLTAGRGQGSGRVGQVRTGGGAGEG